MKMDKTLEIYKAPHPNAPRRSKRPVGYVTMTFSRRAWLRFNKEHPELKISDAEKLNIVETFHENLWKECVENRNGVLLPERMGKLEIITYKASRKRLKIDRVTSKNLGYVVHKNPVLKDDGKKAFVDFITKSESYNMINKALWGFIPLGTFMRAKNAAFSENRGKYKGDKNNRAAGYRKDLFYKKLFARENDEEVLKTYNEFDFS